MIFKKNTYISLIGRREILEFTERLYGQWIIYKDGKPKYHVDCFDFKHESNQQLNHLLLSRQQSIRKIIRNINKKKKVKLSVVTPRFIDIKTNSKTLNLKLEPLPLELITM